VPRVPLGTFEGANCSDVVGVLGASWLTGG
jgi:hypothetical protein